MVLGKYIINSFDNFSIVPFKHKAVKVIRKVVTMADIFD